MTEKKAQKPLHIGKPAWLKTPLPSGRAFSGVKSALRERGLYTVCEEAKCPNIGECWEKFTATFMILGDTCTRACRFCNVKTGNPQGWRDPEEPQKVADAVRLMKLDYVVITMVDRDDMADYGASHIYQVLCEVRRQSPGTLIEFLGGDMAGDDVSLSKVVAAPLDVFAHNLETVEELTPRVRDARAAYGQSLQVLKNAKVSGRNGLLTKSALMLGLGESDAQVERALDDLREVDVDIITLGQYMRPTKKHLAIKSFVHPDRFDHWKEVAYSKGFKGVMSGPLVRSSYNARDLFHEVKDTISSNG